MAAILSGIKLTVFTRCLFDRPGVKAAFGVAIDTANLAPAQDRAAHKVGASFTFEG